MPGVPREMTYMWEHQVEPTLIAGAVLRWRTLKLLGIGESSVEETLGDLVRSTAPTVATYAKNDGVHIRVTDKAPDAATADARIAAMEHTVRERLGRYVWGTDDDTLGSVIGGALVRREWRLATAESLSAGDIARTLVEALGSAQWYARGVVLPHADAATLEASLDRRIEVRLVVPHGDGTSELTVTTPDEVKHATVRFGPVAEGRRRSLLAGLDLLRQVLSR
jgi:nicotinamide-nucleotide amidase